MIVIKGEAHTARPHLNPPIIMGWEGIEGKF